MMINNEMESDPLLSQVLELLRQWALSKQFDPEKSLVVRFKSEIFPVVLTK
jgi:hypothetical protein